MSPTRTDWQKLFRSWNKGYRGVNHRYHGSMNVLGTEYPITSITYCNETSGEIDNGKPLLPTV